ncbi:MAG: hypothetical protein ACK5CW_09050, partial [Verrucomicrobiota bacterium]
AALLIGCDFLVGIFAGETGGESRGSAGGPPGRHGPGGIGLEGNKIIVVIAAVIAALAAHFTGTGFWLR